MGRLYYDRLGSSVEIDDRPLAHLQVVMGIKLRRRESFFFSWPNSVSRGGGRNSVWVSPSSPLVFRFSGHRLPAINAAWVDALMKLANSPPGLMVSREPEAPS